MISAATDKTVVWAALHRRPPFPRLVHYLIDNGADLRDSLEALFVGPYLTKPCATGILEKLLLQHDTTLPQPWNSVPIDKHPLIILLRHPPTWLRETATGTLLQLAQMMLARVRDIEHPALLHSALSWHETIFKEILSTPGAQRCLLHDPTILQGNIPAQQTSDHQLKNLETLLITLKEMGKEEVLRGAQTYPYRSIAALQLLVKYGADLERRDAAGWTIMMLRYRDIAKQWWVSKTTIALELQEAAQSFRGMGAKDLTVEDMTMLEVGVARGSLWATNDLASLRAGRGFSA